MKNRVIFIASLMTCLMMAALAHAENRAWDKSDFMWNFGIISSCDIGMPYAPGEFFAKEDSLPFNPNLYKNIPARAIVWMRTKWFAQFYREVFPSITNSFVLVVASGDESFPVDTGLSVEEIEQFLADQRVIQVFTQNYDYQGMSRKLQPIPIGLDLHTMAYKERRSSPKEQEAVLYSIMKGLLPTYQRKIGAFVDFHHNDTTRCAGRYLQYGEDRASIFQRLVTTGLIDHSTRLERSELWRTKGLYAFSISPHGNGLDCHRTWEDLILGCIVIVKTSSLDSLYEGLPVVIVKDWDEVTLDNMKRWIIQYGDAFTNPSYREKLLRAYWLNKIIKAAHSYED